MQKWTSYKTLTGVMTKLPPEGIVDEHGAIKIQNRIEVFCSFKIDGDGKSISDTYSHCD